MTHVHLIGIGGTGISSIARVLLEKGYTVSGSDRVLSPLAADLADAGVTVYEGHSADHIKRADIVVRSSAITDENVEVVAAQTAGIPVLKRSDFLGSLMENNQVIAVAGSHGKTTTSAMLAWTLSALQLDPSYILGGVSKNLSGNAHAGKGKFFVIEADEYDRMFLGLKPNVILLTNVEYDHPDCYPSVESYHKAFLEFIQLLQPEGILITDTDQSAALEMLAALPEKYISFGYGFNNDSQYRAVDVHVNELGGMSFQVVKKGSTSPLVSVALQVPGEHNVRNALGVIAVHDQLGNSLNVVSQALGEFKGTGRRFDVVGEAKGITIIDDYAHHPTKITATLSAARLRFPGRRLVAVWQPHTFSRTQTLEQAFMESIRGADLAIVTDIYASREKPQGYSAKQFVEKMGSSAVIHIASLPEVTDYLLNNLRNDDVLLVLSAGDADQVCRDVLAGLQNAISNDGKPSNSTGISHNPGSPIDEDLLVEQFGSRLQQNVLLSGLTTARVGGPARYYVVANNADELGRDVSFLWSHDIPVFILGTGANVLLSDSGFDGVVVHNRAKGIVIDWIDDQPRLTAESGANLGTVARQAALNGLTGLEWASTVPGSLGGAVYGNAGAHGGNMQQSLVLANILHREKSYLSLSSEQMAYAYRSSLLKRNPGAAVILSAQLAVAKGDTTLIKARMDENSEKRRRTQPPGSSMGSTFKNPVGDHAGRLIEAAGLKGTRVGGAQVSPVHANFIINDGSASAEDIYKLIRLVQKTVKEAFGVDLELEIELLGDWTRS